MAENNSWVIFLRLLCESGKATRESGLYKLIIEHFPIQFMQKLLSTAVDVSSTQRGRDYAAGVMIELNDANLLENNYSKIDDDMQILDSLRRNALDLTVDYEVGSAVQVCGEQTAFKLLRQSLKIGEITWDGFLEFAEEGFTSTSASAAGYLSRFLAIFCGLPSRLRNRLVLLMKGRIRRKSGEFEGRVVQLLRESHDLTPFLILPSIIIAFDHIISPAITRAAIMSQFLADNKSPWKALRVAEILKWSIERTNVSTDDFHDDFDSMDDATSRLCQFLEQSEYSEVAVQLLEAWKTLKEDYGVVRKEGSREQ